jgi:hypothetical protein
VAGNLTLAARLAATVTNATRTDHRFWQASSGHDENDIWPIIASDRIMPLDTE